MGRHRKFPTTDGDVVKESAVGDSGDKKTVNPAVLERLGYAGGQVCMSCNARAPARADKCRKCGSDELREKNADFADA